MNRIYSWCRDTDNLKNFLVAGAMLMTVFAGFVLVSWLYGYWSNGLYGTRFELQSCWTGLGGIITGIGTVCTIAGISLGRHYIDSKFNSPAGAAPEPAAAGERKEH